MNGFLFDENLPQHIEVETTYALKHVLDLGTSLTDTEIWNYAKQNHLTIVTKDTDFSDRVVISKPPPKVIHLRFGNMRKKEFILFVKNIWPQVEELIETHRLVNVYMDRLESIE